MSLTNNCQAFGFPEFRYYFCLLGTSLPQSALDASQGAPSVEGCGTMQPTKSLQESPETRAGYDERYLSELLAQ